MIPKIIHQIWTQGIDKVPAKYHSYINGWKSLDKYGYTYKCWDDDSIKEIISLFDISLIEIYNYFNLPQQRSDLGRYIIIYLFGGFYVDIDIEPTGKSLNSLLDYNFIISKNEYYIRQSFFISSFMSSNFIGIAFLLKHVQPDGGIYVKARANYNTALALMAMLMHPKLENEEVMLRARRFLVSRQMDLDQPGKNDNPLDGGIGYGDDKGNHADLSNTHFVLEALHYAEALLADKGDAAKNEPKLNFGAAISFIERCQNRPESNKSSWVSTDPKDAGGFVYGPGETRGEEFKTADGRTALRSYGSISYAGLLSFIYAGLDREDPRVKAALDWLSKNYTLDENPGLGAQGKFYYFHTMAKALNAAEIDLLSLTDGQTIDWRKQLAEKLLNIQRGDGSWVNVDAARWMEGDAVLTTGYILMALARVHQRL
jgi:squalene-hopene/tetraprenyl-beta-curcumene cyclase